MLDSRMLSSKDQAYFTALDRFRNGAWLIYDGVAFAFFPNNELACSLVAGSVDLDENAARQLAAHGRQVFEQLAASSAEFAQLVSGRTLRVSIVSGFEQHGRELCRIVNGRLDWI